MRPWRLSLAIVLTVAATACSGGSSQGDEPVARSSKPGTFAELPRGAATSDFWVASALPRTYDLASATDHQGPNGNRAHVTGYSQDPTRDQSNAPLLVESTPGPLRLPDGSSTVVRGHPAVLSTLTDEGRPYGQRLAWHERKGLTITVSALEGLTVTDARQVAEHVRPVSPELWRRMVIATSYIAQATPDMVRAGVSTGHIGGHRWTLTALLPPDYPLLSLDRRYACYELTYRDQRTSGSACWQHPSWVRLAGQVFVFGEVSPDIRQVVVRRSDGPAVTVDARLSNRWSRARFWVALMPTRTCSVNVVPGDHPGASDPRTLGPTGPLLDQVADHRRCASAPSPP